MREEVLYGLRIWRDGEGPDEWRASLKDVRTQELKFFADLALLAAHIQIPKQPLTLGDNQTRPD